MKAIFLLVILAGISACATAPVGEAAAKPVSADRLFAYQVANATSGQVTIIRDSGMLGSGCSMGIYINGTEAARLDTSEKVSLQLPPGRINLEAGPTGSGLCATGMATRSRRGIQIIVESGDHQLFRLATGPNGDVSISPSSF